MVPRIDTAPHAVETQTGVVEPASSGDHESFHTCTSTNPTNRERKRRSSGSMRCGNPNLRFVELAPPGENKILSPDDKSFHKSTTLINRGQKNVPPGRYRPAQCGNPSLGFVHPAPPGEDKVASPGPKYFQINVYLQLQQTGDKTAVPRVDTAPYGV